MKIELTNTQAMLLVHDYIDKALPGERRRLALRVFRRHEDFYPFPVLKEVAKKIEREHCLPAGYVKGEL
jgi:hypothetical protein